jgi:hypothetical protein
MSRPLGAFATTGIPERAKERLEELLRENGAWDADTPLEQQRVPQGLYEDIVALLPATHTPKPRKEKR